MTRRDRLRELLDVVLDEDHGTLEEMVSGPWTTPYHFNRQLSRGTGEPLVSMRRRVIFERASWQLRRGPLSLTRRGRLATSRTRVSVARSPGLSGTRLVGCTPRSRP